MDPNTRALIMGAAGASGDKIYVEDVFSTWLYTSTSSPRTITNGIDLSGKGGLVWIKGRSGATGHRFTDTSRGATKSLESNSTAVEATESTGLTAFGSTGFTIGADTDYNTSSATYASWTFRKAPKFFDVVTYTGTGANRTIAHNLGSVPGCIIVKRTDAVANWIVYHNNIANTEYLLLNSTAAKATSTSAWNSTTPTSSVFSLGTDAGVNATGGTYVAYLFAHNAGGFGASGNDDAVSCGTYTGNGSVAGPTITLGWEPQWLLIKRTDAVADWQLIDNMRGFTVAGSDAVLNPNLTGAETLPSVALPLSTGFQLNTTSTAYNASAGTYIYIAIRRGPMKTPTDATNVFALGATAPGSVGFGPVLPFGDCSWLCQNRANNGVSNTRVFDRLRGIGFNGGTSYRLATISSAIEDSLATVTTTSGAGTSMAFFDANNLYTSHAGNANTTSGAVSYDFRRAPGFFDIVCYTGTGASRTVNHNLAFVPSLIIVKRRDTVADWQVYHNSLANTEYLVLNTTAAKATGATRWNSTTPTNSVFSLGTDASVNATGGTYVAYLFSPCSGVSNVGSYTGTGSTLQIECGFAAGARFVMIKRADSTGSWFFWDTARGITTGNDPYLLMNTIDSEVTNTDYIDPYAPGFEISSTAPAAINGNGGTYIYLAMA